MVNNQEYVEWFRGAAPYIKAHRKKTFVILVSDEVILTDQFIGLVHDIALLNHLGINLVLLHSSRTSIDAHLRKNQIESRFHQNSRITDDETLPLVIQAINEVRTLFESHLSMGLPNTPMSGSDISLLGGNFVIGMPLGVIDGVDMQHSGRVREVKHQQLGQMLSLNHVVLLSNLGYSRTGEVFNLPAEELASEVAIKLKADKLIFINHDLVENLGHSGALSTQDCEIHLSEQRIPPAMQNVVRQSIRAVQAQVKRVHLIDRKIEGGLLLELFTRNGCGSMITNLFYEGIRTATIDDIGGILGLIEPLEGDGTLVQRSHEQLELEIAHFQVIEKDGMVIACIACIPASDEVNAEIACLAVHEDYQRTGLGQQLLAACEHQATKQKIKNLYSLTTRTSHWFLEHGFFESTQFKIPDSRRQLPDPERGSKIFVKPI